MILSTRLPNFVLILTLLCVIVVLSSADKGNELPMTLRRMHGFQDPSHQLANEFQLLHVENIISIDELLDNPFTSSHKYENKLMSSFLDSSSAYEYSILDISPLLINNDDVVQVSFYSSHPSTSDWIGAYAPLDLNDLTTVVPVKYGFCDETEDYLTTGYGSLSFNLTNLRSSVGFAYFTNGLTYPVYMNSSSQFVNFINENQPLRPRVVATGDYDIFNLLWSSATSETPLLKWGTVSGVYDNIVSANTSFIPQSSMCGSPANSTGWRDLGLIHTASFVGMMALASQKVYYIFGDEATNDFSGEYTLHVPPLPGTQPEGRATTVILFDDLGRGSTDNTYTWNEYGRPAIYTSMSVGAEVIAGTVDAIYHGGDISYATGYIAVWDFFLDMISPMASGTLYLSTVGNHESDWPNTASYYTGTDSGGECGVMTTTLLPMPQPAVTNKPWWSYDVGIIHFIGMSTEHNYTIGSEQYIWLENDLQSVNRTISPWIIFGGHRAMYVNSDYGGTVSSDIVVMDNMINNIEPLLWKYRVNVGFYGHNHVVNRNAAVLNQQVIQHAEARVMSDGETLYYHDNPQATVQMVVGTGGASFTENAVTPGPDWNELFFYQWGYARVTALNESYLNWEWVNSTTGSVVDHMMIYQDDATQPWVIDSGNDNSDGISTGEIVIIAVCVFFGVALLAVVAIFLSRRFKLDENNVNSSLIPPNSKYSTNPV